MAAEPEANELVVLQSLSVSILPMEEAGFMRTRSAVTESRPRNTMEYFFFVYLPCWKTENIRKKLMAMATIWLRDDFPAGFHGLNYPHGFKNR